MKEQAKQFGAGAVGAILIGLLGTGVLATKADLEAFRADMAEKYVAQSVFERRFEEVQGYLKRIMDKLDRITEREK